MRIYYVYMYLREDLTPYYVGKGKYKRAFIKSVNHNPPADKNLIFFVKENVSEQEAFYWEMYYINKYGRKDNNTGVLRNLTDGGKGTAQHIKHQNIIDNISYYWVVKFKDNQPEVIKNLREFCRRNNLDQSTMRRLANGECIQHKGYQCRYNGNLLFDFYDTKPEYKFISPTGNIFNVSNLREFSKKHCLDHSCLSKLIHKKRKQHKGWKLIE